MVQVEKVVKTLWQEKICTFRFEDSLDCASSSILLYFVFCAFGSGFKH
jgi:hypothetical protein